MFSAFHLLFSAFHLLLSKFDGTQLWKFDGTRLPHNSMFHLSISSFHLLLSKFDGTRLRKKSMSRPGEWIWTHILTSSIGDPNDELDHSTAATPHLDWFLPLTNRTSPDKYTVPHRKPDDLAFEWPSLRQFLSPTFECIWPPFCIESRTGVFLRLA